MPAILHITAVSIDQAPLAPPSRFDDVLSSDAARQLRKHAVMHGVLSLRRRGRDAFMSEA